MQFSALKEEHLELILRWRTSDFVTRFMYTDIEYDIEKQKEWFQLIQKDPNCYYWIMIYKDCPIGLVSITDINARDKRAYWNFYIGDPAYSMLGGFIGPYVYNYAFQSLGLHKLLGEVMEENDAVRKLHLKQGAREVGFLADHIYKYEKYHNVFIYEMTKEQWNTCGDKFARYIAIIR